MIKRDTERIQEAHPNRMKTQDTHKNTHTQDTHTQREKE